MFIFTSPVFFFFLANIILLAHAVIPHHHHSSEICLANSHKHYDNDAHQNCLENEQSNHHNSSNAEDCSLNQVVVIPNHQIKHEIKFIDNGDPLQQFNSIQSVLFTQSIDNLFCVNTSNIKPPLLTSTYSFFAGNSIGLRAPPIS